MLEGKTDIAAVSRPWKQKEIDDFVARKGRRPLQVAVALDGVGIYVHQDNPVGRLTVEQLKGIFSGRIRNWAEVGGPNRRIHVYTRDKLSGTREIIQERILHGDSLVSTAIEVETSEQMEASIARNLAAIGYGGIAYAPGTRIVRIVTAGRPGGIAPSTEEVATFRYPLSRTLNLCVDPEAASPAVRDFLRWVLGPEGQQIVASVGYFPMRSSQGPSGSAAEEGPAVTPATMRAHCLEVSVRREPVDGSRGWEAWLAHRVDIEAVLTPACPEAASVESVHVRIGNTFRAPLAFERPADSPGPCLVRFRLAREWLTETRLVLVSGPRIGADKLPSAYEIVIDSFLQSD